MSDIDILTVEMIAKEAAEKISNYKKALRYKERENLVLKALLVLILAAAVTLMFV